MLVEQQFLAVSRGLSPEVKVRVRRAASTFLRRPGTLQDPRSVLAAAREALAPWFPRATPRQLDTYTFYMLGALVAVGEKPLPALDAMNELGEARAFELQMRMDRISRLMTALSSLLKKSSETQSGVTQNIK